MRNWNRTKLVCALLFGGVFGLSAVTWAQTVTGSVTGEITDPSGGVLPQAIVVAENVDTGVKTTTTEHHLYGEHARQPSAERAGFFGGDAVPAGFGEYARHLRHDQHRAQHVLHGHA